MKDDPSISINEIFYSIQGEAKNSGKPTVFIRTAGCPFDCSYCDTEYAFTEGKQTSVSNIINKIENYKTKYITITGGEPLVQKNINILFNKLLENKYYVSLETSGLVDISSIPKNVEIVMDIKTPSSNESDKNIIENLKIIKLTDVIKFVIETKEDYEWSKNIIFNNSLTNHPNIYLSPVHDNLEPSLIASWILEDSLNVTLQLQIHKYIWGDVRGR